MPDIPKVVFVLGGPGAGKGTQCANIVKEFGWCHLSAGDLLREERASGSADADLINNYIKEGKIVPVEITVKLLLAAMKKSGKSKFLIDGFPRSLNNYEGWVNVVGAEAEVAFCLNYDCPEAELERRLMERGKSSGRDDDNIESIRKRCEKNPASSFVAGKTDGFKEFSVDSVGRDLDDILECGNGMRKRAMSLKSGVGRFKTFESETKPVFEIFQSKGKLKIISSVKSIEEVWAETKELFATL